MLNQNWRELLDQGMKQDLTFLAFIGCSYSFPHNKYDSIFHKVCFILKQKWMSSLGKTSRSTGSLLPCFLFFVFCFFGFFFFYIFAFDKDKWTGRAFLFGFTIFIFKLCFSHFDCIDSLLPSFFQCLYYFVRICILKWWVFNIFTTHWWFSEFFVHPRKTTFTQGLVFKESFANILYIPVSLETVFEHI